MYRDMEVRNNNIGTAIQYFRESFHISQSKLCKGICSVSTLSRIEAGERDVDALILETLLERLGKVTHHFELILTDFDYKAYICREEIKKKIKDKDIEKARKLIHEYDKLTIGKGSPHRQFIMVNRAYLNELEGKEPKTTIDLLMEAITCTVPDFNTNEIRDYYLSVTELNIILEILQRMIALRMDEKAERILNQIIGYLYWHGQMAYDRKIYLKVAVIAGKFFMKHNKIDKALEICDITLKMYKGSNKMDYIGELLYIKAQLLERIYINSSEWEPGRKTECLKLYLQAYHVFDFCEEKSEAEEIRNHLLEVYQWEDIG